MDWRGEWAGNHPILTRPFLELLAADSMFKELSRQSSLTTAFGMVSDMRSKGSPAVPRAIFCNFKTTQCHEIIGDPGAIRTRDLEIRKMNDDMLGWGY